MVLKNNILLIFSLIFYAWGEPILILVMIFSIFANYFFGILIDKSRSNFFLSIAVLSNLALLFYFKYFAFFIANLINYSNLDLAIPSITMPIGISFFTFQAISYLVDLSRREIHVQKNLLNLALYIALFPQLIAGPIVRYASIENQITNRTSSKDDILYGIRRFIIGLGKKVIIANQFAIFADMAFALPESDLTSKIVICAILAYSIQIYFDFSGYCDMAIGLGRIFGFHFNENFNYPYSAKSIQEFWRRWHISLSTFLRDYLYIPLGGSRTSQFKTLRNLMITFLLCGFWHGAAWNFILWGAYFGFFLILERIFLAKFLEKLPKFLALFYCLIVVAFGWLIFRAENFSHFISLFNALFSDNVSHLHRQFTKNKILIILLIFAIFGSTNLFQKYVFHAKNKNILILMDVFLLLVFAISISFLAAGTYNPFIYFRF
jgi:alginate O-acetyltransferase complex protein AlgI